MNSARSTKLYSDRLKILKSARLILSISEATRRDAIELFGLSPGKIVNIGIAPSVILIEWTFRYPMPFAMSKKRHGVEGAFITNGQQSDHRKNLFGLLRAFTGLPQAILKEFSLIVVCNSSLEYVNKDKKLSELLVKSTGVRIKFLYFISTEDLIALYNLHCHLFVYASLYEGGGLPVMEAMKCGAPVIASNTSSIPEYMGRNDNIFNPRDEDDIKVPLFVS